MTYVVTGIDSNITVLCSILSKILNKYYNIIIKFNRYFTII